MAVDVDAMVTALCSDSGAAASSSTKALLHLTGSGDMVSAFPVGFVVPAPADMDSQAPSAVLLPAPSVTPLGQPEPPLSPTWDEIALDDRSTILHIPRGALEAVTRTFVAVRSRFLSGASWESFHALWAFPKAVLAPLSRGGKTHYIALRRKVAARARAYMDRPLAASWAESKLPDRLATRVPGGRWHVRARLHGTGCTAKWCALLATGLCPRLSKC